MFVTSASNTISSHPRRIISSIHRLTSLLPAYNCSCQCYVYGYILRQTNATWHLDLSKVNRSHKGCRCLGYNVPTPRCLYFFFTVSIPIYPRMSPFRCRSILPIMQPKHSCVSGRNARWHRYGQFLRKYLYVKIEYGSLNSLSMRSITCNTETIKVDSSCLLEFALGFWQTYSLDFILSRILHSND